jgi:hypothetical protein
LETRLGFFDGGVWDYSVMDEIAEERAAAKGRERTWPGWVARTTPRWSRLELIDASEAYGRLVHGLSSFFFFFSFFSLELSFSSHAFSHSFMFLVAAMAGFDARADLDLG